MQDLYTSTAPGCRFDNYISCYFRRLDEPFYPFYRIPLNLGRVFLSVRVKAIIMKKVFVFIGSGLMVFASLSATECRSLDQNDQHQRPRPNRRDRIENKRDRREDVRDKREDIRDRREDIRDDRFQGGPRDKREDIRDKREDVRDRREDVRDRRENRRDRRRR